MLENVMYINHLGETIWLDGRAGIFCNRNDLRDFSYSVTTKNDRISSFNKGVVKKSLPVLVVCSNEKEGTDAKNRLFEVMEKDVLASQHGKFVINDYYLMCFVTGSAKTEYYHAKRYMMTTLTIQTDLPEWIRETVNTFGYMGKGPQGKNMDFCSDFLMDYTSNLVGKAVVNKGFVASNFKIVIYGAAEIPAVKVGGHLYQVNVTFKNNEYLTIDSVSKTIILTHVDGSQENVFSKRNRDFYIFEKISPGIGLVEMDGCKKADITILEERSEPKWI